MRLTIRTFASWDQADGWYTVDVTGIDGPILIPREALANRMFTYGLDSEEAALDAIVREHAVRLELVDPVAAGSPGGDHPDVQVAHKAEAKAQLDDVLNEDAQVLQMHRARAGIAPRAEWAS